MRHQLSSDSEITAYFKSLPTPQRGIAESLRDIIVSSIPDLEEHLKWGKPWYSKNGNICYLFAFHDHVNFGLVKGARIRDPNGLLEGTGKGMRNIKIKSAADIRRREFTRMLKEAAELNDAIV